ncbi:MAG: serine/threonine-protein kinase [Myxococcota bacterium]
MSDWTQLRRAFNAALDAPVADRSAAVASACGDDSALAAQVETLLASYRGAEHFLEEPAVLLAAVPEPVEGSQFGVYRIEALIGQGGMGSVWTARRNDEQFEKRVAIKLLSAWPTPDLVERFRTERQILATLEHPNITRLLDGGVTADGRPYLVMEYVDGAVPIDQHADGLPIETRLRMFVSVCNAVAYAHKHLVVHRDLKPTNVLVSSEGRIKLLDFGIAKMLGRSDGGPTLAGLMSPVCASPEQVRGEPVTTATDVYGLGVLLFRMLTGAFPHDVAELSAAEVVAVICGDEAPKASTIGGQALAGDLDAIVGKALRKAVDQRYASVEALRDDVQRYLEHRPISLREHAPGYVLRKLVRRHRAIVVAATIAALALVTGSSLALWQARVARTQRDQARIAGRKSARIAQFLVDVFESANALESPHAADVPVSQLLEQGERNLAALRDDPEIRAEMLHVLGRVTASIGRYAHARGLLQRALAEQEALVDSPHRSLAAIEFDLGRVHLLLGDPEKASEHANESLRQRRAVLPEQHPRIGASMILVGRIGHDLDDRQALALCRDGLSLLRARLAPDDWRLAKAVRHVANALRERGESEEAKARYLEALAAFESHDPEHYEVAATREGLAAVLSQIGDEAGAARESRAALAIKAAWLPRDHPLLVASLTEDGHAAFGRGDYGTALQQWERALAIQTRTLGPRDVEVALLMSRVASAHGMLGDLALAEQLTTEALAIVDDDHPYQAVIRARLDDLIAKRGGTTNNRP